MGILDGKVGLVVGIANERSYAWFIAQALLAQGARCAFTCLPGEKNLRRTERSIRALGIADPWIREMDAADDAQIERAIADFGESFGGMHFLVHSIAFADRQWLQKGSFHQTPRDAYLQAIDISAYSLVAMARTARPLMRDAGGGSIIAMSYYGSEKVVPGYNIMGVAKACLECSARYLASELGEDNIRVNTISGGYLRTLASSAVGGADEISKHNLERAPLRRNVEGSDVGGAAAWLVSDLAGGVTGENIYVDCGVNTIGV